MKNLFNFATRLIENASKIVKNNSNRLNKYSYKIGDFNLVTKIDKKVEKYILEQIINQFPNHTIIAEESGVRKRNESYQWFIDPIDGTTNFAHNYPCFCTSIAFAKNGIIEFGLIKNPLTGELYTAIRNQGAKLNGKTIRVSKVKKLKDSLLSTGFPYDKRSSRKNNLKNFSRLTLITHGVRRDGSAALDLCYVASGKIDGFWELKLSPWDVAAGILIVKEAGGKITGFKGEKYSIYDKEIVSTNGLVHKELLGYLE